MDLQVVQIVTGKVKSLEDLKSLHGRAPQQISLHGHASQGISLHGHAPQEISLHC